MLVQEQLGRSRFHLLRLNLDLPGRFIRYNTSSSRVESLSSHRLRHHEWPIVEKDSGGERVGKNESQRGLAANDSWNSANKKREQARQKTRPSARKRLIMRLKRARKRVEGRKREALAFPPTTNAPETPLEMWLRIYSKRQYGHKTRAKRAMKAVNLWLSLLKLW